MNVVTIVQARRGSSRLPDKVLLPAAGRPLLAHQLERMSRASTVGRVVVATTREAEDDIIVSLCESAGFSCYRGSTLDLLDRHLRAALVNRAEAVVKIPSDCPLIDPAVIDRVIGFFLDHAHDYDYVSNLRPATWPDGQDVEIMTLAALETAWREADRNFEREHTTPFLWERPERFRIGNVAWETGLDYSRSHRWTLDYAADFEFIRSVYERLYPYHPEFGVADVLSLVERDPALGRINQSYQGVNWYRHHLRELRTISPEQTSRPQGEGDVR